MDIIVVTMAWTKAEQIDEASDELLPIRYWLSRLAPVLKADKRTFFVACNRTGREGNTEYQGHSCVVEINHGKLTVLDKLKFEEELLVVEIDLNVTT